MNQLIATLARGAVFFQDTIHRPRRAKILAFIEQGSVDCGGRAILEALGIEQGANRFAFVQTQRASGKRPCGQRRKRNGQGRSEQWAMPIEGSPSDAQRVAGRLDADGGRELQDGIHYGFSSGSTVASGRPNSIATFF
jgi:hypothetical protein